MCMLLSISDMMKTLYLPFFYLRTNVLAESIGD